MQFILPCTIHQCKRHSPGDVNDIPLYTLKVISIQFFWKALKYNVILSYALFELSEYKKVYLNVLLVGRGSETFDQSKGVRQMLAVCLSQRNEDPIHQGPSGDNWPKDTLCEQSNGEW